MSDETGNADGQPAGSFRFPAGMLHLEYTLTNGQCFRWRRDPAIKAAPAGQEHWQGIAAGRVIWLSRYPGVADGEDEIRWRVQGDADAADPDLESWLRAYLRLDVDLAAIYADWQARDPYLDTLTETFRGLRLLDQDPEECLLSFCCSKANAIPRIQRAIGELSRAWGTPIAGSTTYYRFPAAATLAGLNPEVVAARTGLEWRAAGLIEVAAQVADRPADWLAGLRAENYATAHAELTRLRGVGAKIADCVCAFALGKDQAVPVDTHVFQLTRDRYLPDLRGKSLTDSLYGKIGTFWRQRFGPYAGWAQQYLFYDHLLEARRTGRSPQALT